MGRTLNGKPLTETMMSGAALMSTVTQTQSLGNIGQEVLESFGIKEVDLAKHYSYRIRGAIHEAVFKRFGEEALFYFGYTQLDGYAAVMKSVGFPIEKHIKNIRDQLNSRDINVAVEARDSLMSKIGETISVLTNKTIFCPKGELVTAYTGISQAVGQYSLTNAVFPQHEGFNRGALTRLLTYYLANNWSWKVIPITAKMQSGKGWATFVWNIEFTRHKKQHSFYKEEIGTRQIARDKFIKKVLADADKQKKDAEKQKAEAEKQKAEAEKQKEITQQLANQLGRYIPPQIHDALLAGDYNTEVTTRRKKLTVFFSDIKNFTSTSEALQPEDLTNYLNEYFSEMTSIALAQGATIDKYIGDAMMVFFGDPVSKGERNDARACVEMALQMQEKMSFLQDKWRNQGFADPFQVRMGINTGYCNVGNFGSDQRLTYTIIGGEVNVAARLETAAEANGILLPYETYAHAQDMIEVEQKESIKMKGINREIKIFSVKGRKKHIIDHQKSENLELNGQHIDVDGDTNVNPNKGHDLEEFVLQLKLQVEKLNDEIQNLKDRLD